MNQKEVGFTIDAGLIQRLGYELVGKAETAVSELIKNAYDADARNVNVYFKYSDAVGGSLIISDDGLGMTEEQLVNGFMRISSSEKYIILYLQDMVVVELVVKELDVLQHNV